MSNNDLISREWLKDAFDNLCCHNCKMCRNFRNEDSFYKCDLIDKAPTVEERPQGEWIAIKYRPLTEKERIAFAEYYGVEYCDTLDEKAFDCPMPEDCQHILISTSWGVAEDFAYNDIDGEGFICHGLENNGDWDGVDAWRPCPEPYMKGGAE